MIADGRYVLPNGLKASIIWHLKAVPNGILEMSLELCDLSISMADYIWPYKVKTFALGRQILLIAHGAMPHYGSYHVCNNVRKFERIFC